MDRHLLRMPNVLFHHLLCAGQMQCLFEWMDLIKKSRKRENLRGGTKRRLLRNIRDSAEIRISHSRPQSLHFFWSRGWSQQHFKMSSTGDENENIRLEPQDELEIKDDGN